MCDDAFLGSCYFLWLLGRWKKMHALMGSSHLVRRLGEGERGMPFWGASAVQGCSKRGRERHDTLLRRSCCAGPLGEGNGTRQAIWESSCCVELMECWVNRRRDQ